MLNKGLLSAVALLLVIGVACGTSGPMSSDDKTALTGVVIEEGSYDRVANATVTLTGDDMSTVTGEGGTFSFVGVSVGTHEVTIESDTHGTTTKSIEVQSGGSRVEIFIGG